MSEFIDSELSFIFGGVGSGKMNFAMKYASDYHKRFPDRKIYLIGSSQSHICDVDFEFTKLEYDGDRSYEEFSDSLVIFDAYAITSNSVWKGIFDKDVLPPSSWRDQLIKNRRKYNITICTLVHCAYCYSYANFPRIESDKLVIFPKYCSSQNLEKLRVEFMNIGKYELKWKMGLSAEILIYDKRSDQLYIEYGDRDVGFCNLI